LLYRLRANSRRRRLSAEPAIRRPAVRRLCQSGTGLLMRALRVLAFSLVSVVALAALLFALLQTSRGQRLLADLVSGKALTGSGLDGVFPTDLRVQRIELRDEQGPWLTVENARLRWSFASLFEDRV